jgi:hypothetical protein
VKKVLSVTCEMSTSLCKSDDVSSQRTVSTRKRSEATYLNDNNKVGQDKVGSLLAQ